MTGYDSYKLKMWLLVVCTILYKLKTSPKPNKDWRNSERKKQQFELYRGEGGPIRK